MLQFLCLQMCVYGWGVVPHGGVGVTCDWPRCACQGVFVAPACGDTATETLRPKILPKATTLDLRRAQCPRFALTQASGLADTALERGHTICRPSRWTTKRYEGCATSSARRFRRPWERPHNSSQVQRLESETHPHLQRAPAKVQADHKTPPNPRGQQDPRPRPDHSPQPASQPLVQGAKRCEKIPKTRKFESSKT